MYITISDVKKAKSLEEIKSFYPRYKDVINMFKYAKIFDEYEGEIEYRLNYMLYLYRKDLFYQVYGKLSDYDKRTYVHDYIFVGVRDDLMGRYHLKVIKENLPEIVKLKLSRAFSLWMRAVVASNILAALEDVINARDLILNNIRCLPEFIVSPGLIVKDDLYRQTLVEISKKYPFGKREAKYLIKSKFKDVDMLNWKPGAKEYYKALLILEDI